MSARKQEPQDAAAKAWDEALAQPSFRAAINAGLADLASPAPAKRAPAVDVRIDYATGERVCAWCEGEMVDLNQRARFCSHGCRSMYHNTPEKKALRRAAGGKGE